MRVGAAGVMDVVRCNPILTAVAAHESSGQGFDKIKNGSPNTELLDVAVRGAVLCRSGFPNMFFLRWWHLILQESVEQERSKRGWLVF